jgi:heme/copper-type cytochrome/quinol oxidase subunit 3
VMLFGTIFASIRIRRHSNKMPNTNDSTNSTMSFYSTVWLLTMSATHFMKILNELLSKPSADISANFITI